MLGLLTFNTNTELEPEEFQKTLPDGNTCSLFESDRGWNRVTVQAVVPIHKEEPSKSVQEYRDQTGFDIDIYLLKWCGNRFTEEDEEALE